MLAQAAADAFDPQVYLNNRADNVKNMAESKMRNRGGKQTPSNQHVARRQEGRPSPVLDFLQQAYTVYIPYTAAVLQ